MNHQVLCSVIFQVVTKKCPPPISGTLEVIWNASLQYWGLGCHYTEFLPDPLPQRKKLRICS